MHVYKIIVLGLWPIEKCSKGVKLSEAFRTVVGKVQIV